MVSGQVMGGYPGAGGGNSQHPLGRKSNFVESEYISDSRLEDAASLSHNLRVNESG